MGSLQGYGPSVLSSLKVRWPHCAGIFIRVETEQVTIKNDHHMLNHSDLVLIKIDYCYNQGDYCSVTPGVLQWERERSGEC